MDSQKTLSEIHCALSDIECLRTRAKELRKLSQDNHVKRMLFARRKGESMSAVFMLPSNHPNTSQRTCIPNKKNESDRFSTCSEQCINCKTKTRNLYTESKTKTTSTSITNTTEFLEKNLQNTENAEISGERSSALYLKQSHGSPSKHNDLPIQRSVQENLNVTTKEVSSRKNIHKKSSQAKLRKTGSDSKCNVHSEAKELQQNISRLPTLYKAKTKSPIATLSSLSKRSVKTSPSKSDCRLKSPSQFSFESLNVKDTEDNIVDRSPSFTVKSEMTSSSKANTQPQKKNMNVLKKDTIPVKKKIPSKTYNVPPKTSQNDKNEEKKQCHENTFQKTKIHNEQKSNKKKSSWAPLCLKLNSSPPGILRNDEEKPLVCDQLFSLESLEDLSTSLSYQTVFPAKVSEPHVIERMQKFNNKTSDKVTGNSPKSSNLFTFENRQNSTDTKKKDNKQNKNSKIPVPAPKTAKRGNVTSDDQPSKLCEIIKDESVVSLPDLNVICNKNKTGVTLLDSLPCTDSNSNVSFWLENMADTNEADIIGEGNLLKKNEFWKDVINDTPFCETDNLSFIRHSNDQDEQKNKTRVFKNKMSLDNSVKTNCKECSNDDIKVINSKISSPKDKDQMSAFFVFSHSTEKNVQILENKSTSESVSKISKQELDHAFLPLENDFMEKPTSKSTEEINPVMHTSGSEEINTESFQEGKKKKAAKIVKIVKGGKPELTNTKKKLPRSSS